MLTILPILLPLLSAVVFLLFLKSTARRRFVLGLSAGLQLCVSAVLVYMSASHGPSVMALGGWAAPYGIVLVADLLAAIMVFLTSLIAFGSILFGFLETSVENEHPLRIPLVQFLVVGMNLSALTGDLFNLFVAFEVMLISSYALLTTEADDWDVRQAYPYLAINLFGSALFVCLCAYAYGLFGTLNMAHIAQRAPELADDPMLMAFGFFAMLIFGIKAGIFPLYYWLPNAYPILPISLGALFAVLTKIGIYVLLRIFGTVLPHDLVPVYQVLAGLAAATMVFGVIGAASRGFVRGILSFHILSQVGYMMLAIAFMTPYAFAACILFLAHNAIVKSSLFLVGGVTWVLNGSDSLKKTGGLWSRTPALGVAFLLLALSLAGIPPLSGFWGKYMIVIEGFRQGEYFLTACAIATGLLTLYSMLKIWMGVFWQNATDPVTTPVDRRWIPMTGIIGVLTLISVLMGLFPDRFIQLASDAADAALDRQGYIDAVLPSNP